jgi:hypothetical protein
MKFFSLTILLAFATRTVLSEGRSSAHTEFIGGTMAPTTTYADMMMQRNQAPDSELRKGYTGTTKNAVKDSELRKGYTGTTKNAVKGAKGAKKGGNEGNVGGVIGEGKCATNQNNLSFVIFPDFENPVVTDFQSLPAAGVVFVFDGDFSGFQSQTFLFLAEGLIAQGQDSYVFFNPEQTEIVGSIAVLFGSGISVIAGGTGIFLGADGELVINNDNELGQDQVVFDICVRA